jgi:hypothetical protein
MCSPAASVKRRALSRREVLVRDVRTVLHRFFHVDEPISMTGRSDADDKELIASLIHRDEAAFVECYQGSLIRRAVAGVGKSGRRTQETQACTAHVNPGHKYQSDRHRGNNVLCCAGGWPQSANQRQRHTGTHPVGVTRASRCIVAALGSSKYEAYHPHLLRARANRVACESSRFGRRADNDQVEDRRFGNRLWNP